MPQRPSSNRVSPSVQGKSINGRFNSKSFFVHSRHLQTEINLALFMTRNWFWLNLIWFYLIYFTFYILVRFILRAVVIFGPIFLLISLHLRGLRHWVLPLIHYTGEINCCPLCFIRIHAMMDFLFIPKRGPRSNVAILLTGNNMLSQSRWFIDKFPMSIPKRISPKPKDFLQWW